MINKQDFLNAFNKDIDMVKGDTLGFNFQLQGLGGETPEAIIFTCAEHYDDVPLFTATLGDGIELVDADSDIATYSVRIAPSKTADLDLARYYYDMELQVDGNVYTLMRGRLTLLYEVTKGV